uniref:Sperm flagellar protein 2 n=1 Tax=Erpetoichthys calabaricus TaxID=27687 RepID=A0A8C4RLI1_ERPCA
SRVLQTFWMTEYILHKYELQPDFDQFSISRMPDSKLNNFTRIEPTLHLLGIPFDLNIAEAIMKEQRGIAARLLYQLFIALQKKKKAGLTGIAMETMRPAAPAKLQAIGSEIYKERLKTIVPRETDLKLQEVSERFKAIGKGIEEKAIQVHYEEVKKMKKLQEELRLQDIEKHRLAKKKQGEIMARIQAAIVQIPKPPPNRTLEAIEARKKQKKQLEVQVSIVTENTKREGINEKEFIVEDPQLYNEYIEMIRQRLEDDAIARDQREKRRRRVLVEQLKVHEIQEEAFREEQLVNRLMRQSQQERRVAVQLMHVRHEKEVIRQNRIFREKQYDEKRLQEFQEALDREAVLAKRAQIEYREQLQKDLELHNRIAVERAQARYRKHYDFCLDLLFDIIDLATKTGEYRELTNNLIPAKMMREWKELFYKGIPLYDQACVDPYPTEPSPDQLLELEKIALLDIQDFMEYEVQNASIHLYLAID